MIPKVIHYCWFGKSPLPELAKKCIASWRIYFPDYEIKEWNEDNFNVFTIPYTAEAYKAKKYAFVSDYARLWVLYQYGGIYFDTDVEVIKSMDDIVERGPFMGYEDEEGNVFGENSCVNPGLGLGVTPRNAIIKEILDIYKSRHLFTWDGKLMDSIVLITTDLLKKKGIILGENGFDAFEGFTIYPKDFFCPKNYYTGKLIITQNTRSIHHYDATWVNNTRTLWEKVKKRLTMIYYRLWGELFVLFY